MQEVNRAILQVTPQPELFNELAPKSWQGLPKAEAQMYCWEDEAGVQRFAIVKPCMLTCAGEIPTKEEAQKIIDLIAALGHPVAFLAELSSMSIPSFPQDQDPTVKEFFEGSFDPTTLSVKTILVAYPAIEETK